MKEKVCLKVTTKVTKSAVIIATEVLKEVTTQYESNDFIFIINNIFIDTPTIMLNVEQMKKLVYSSRNNEFGQWYNIK